MPKFDPHKPRASVNFHCKPCRRTFDAEPARTEDNPDQEHHPFTYFGDCPDCGQETPQSGWDRALQKAWQNATGPKTEEGKIATAKNLEGHPTPDEARRTRFNAMKTGMHAKVATYYPAKPDSYSFCSSCEVDRTWCKSQPACIKQTETFLLHHAAFDQRDPKKLQGLHSNFQAAVFTVLQQILQTIIADGVKITAPQYYTDKEGVMIIAEYFDPETKQNKIIQDIQAHPLFKPLGELMSRNNYSLADMGMTVKVIDQQNDDMGRFAATEAARDNLLEFQQRQTQALERIAGMVDRGRKETDRDPVLLEYNADTGAAEASAK
ncbi:MAG: hypothetical protein Q8M53_11015 [Burkholderiales bacterium]|nr:hypothetical protein [Burkholderiales bacterium]